MFNVPEHNFEHCFNRFVSNLKLRISIILSKFSPQVNILRTLHLDILKCTVDVGEHKINSLLSLLSCVYVAVYQDCSI